MHHASADTSNSFRIDFVTDSKRPAVHAASPRQRERVLGRAGVGGGVGGGDTKREREEYTM